MKTIALESTRVSLSVVVILAFGVLAVAAEIVPTADQLDADPLVTVERLELAPVDRVAAALEDAGREAEGLPTRFAVPEEVSLTPEEIGTWETLPGDRLLLWRLRVAVPGALSLNLGFDRFRLPEGGRLVLHPAEGRQTTREFTEQDNKEHGELWTPVVLTDDLVVELTLPATARHDYDLRLKQVGKGYRFFGEPTRDEPLWCMNDVICPQGDPWRDEINSVALFMIGGTWTGSGAMVNNTLQDGTPYFLTANHCGINTNNDHTMVVYWNFQSPTCEQRDGGSLADYQIGAVRKARYYSSDFCLVELEELPDSSWNVTYSGWDRSDDDALRAVGIHHPWSQEKAISFEEHPTTTTSNLGYEVPGDGTHIRVEDWDDGATWDGSSGSPLYNQNHHVVGQLHSGFSQCGLDSCDWYGRFSESWDAGNTPDRRLRDWLDPTGLSPMTLDLYAPHIEDLYVTPFTGLESQGSVHGPFFPGSLEYTLTNRGASSIDFLVTEDDASWVELAGSTSGILVPGATATVTVSIGTAAADLSAGLYNAQVSFLNLTNGEVDTTRSVRLWVGGPIVAYSWNLDADPGWASEGDWAFGQPLGQYGGQGGWWDPESGYTGDNVLGYNLEGDYTNDMPETHLTTDAIDCSDLQAVTLRFWRWLNVCFSGNDNAYVRVSNDSLSWTTVWQNDTALNDLVWESVAYDISEVADGQSTVYLRWTMGTTDGQWTYSGWNIDDIEILALPAGSAANDDSMPLRTVLGRAAPNPFNPRTTIVFEIPREQSVKIVVYDLLGRRVRLVAEGYRLPGHHEVSWNGRDSAGREMPSGTYVVRLESESGVEARKVMLIR